MAPKKRPSQKSGAGALRLLYERGGGRDGEGGKGKGYAISSGGGFSEFVAPDTETHLGYAVASGDINGDGLLNESDVPVGGATGDHNNYFVKTPVYGGFFFQNPALNGTE